MRTVESFTAMMASVVSGVDVSPVRLGGDVDAVEWTGGGRDDGGC